MFASGTPITGESLSIDGDNAAATAEVGEPSHGGNPAAHSIWWTWTAPRTGTGVIEATGTYTVGGVEYVFTPAVGVYIGSHVAALTRVDQGWVSTPNRNAFSAEAGSVYRIAVDSSTHVGPIRLTLSMQDSPGNDAFASRAVLQGTSILVEGSNVNATSEPSEPIHWTTTDSHSVWWTWTAPASGRVLGKVTTDGLDAVLAVYTGDQLSALSVVDRIGNSGTRIALGFDAVSGTTYQLAVSSHGTSTGTFRLSVELNDPPSNDRFADATTLTGDFVEAEGTNVGAGWESGEPYHDRAALLSSVWWKWTAPASGRVVIDAAGSDFDTVIAVYTGAGLNSLNYEASNNDRTFTDLTSLVQFNAVADITYYVVVDGYNGSTGAIRFTLDLVDPPANDHFANRATLIGSTVDVVASNYGASAEAGEPNHSERQSAIATVWWSWTAPTSDEVIVRTAGSAIDTILAVYTGSALSSLQRVVYDHPWDRATRVVFTASAGTTYHFAVDGQNGTLGALNLSLAYVGPPANDLFANRTMLDGWDVSTVGSNVGATAEPGEPSHFLSSPQTSVWWTWTAPIDGPVVVDTIGSDFDTVLAVYEGSTLASLVQLGRANDISNEDYNSWLMFDAQAGTTYQIAVEGRWQEFGDIVLHLEVQRPRAVIEAPADPVTTGADATLRAIVSGAEPMELQWERNGVAIPGATGASVVLPGVQEFTAAGYTIRVTNTWGTSTSAAAEVSVIPAVPSDAKVLNLSTRARSVGDAGTLIPGFVIQGAGSKRILIRAVGPGLGAFDVAGTLPDPLLTVKQKINGVYQTVAENDNWQNTLEMNDTIQMVGAFRTVPGSFDAALVLDLDAGQYTALAEDRTGQAGRALVEIYDATPSEGAARMVNISNRGYVGTGADVMILGFVVSSEGPKTLLLRTVGPGLEPFGVTGVLADPVMTLYRAEPSPAPASVLLTNDDWGVDANPTTTASIGTQLGAFTLATGSKDAACVVTLAPGIYTVHASGKGGGTGVALVEIYAVP